MCEWAEREAEKENIKCEERGTMQLGSISICGKCNGALGAWKLKNLPFYGGVKGTSTLKMERERYEE